MFKKVESNQKFPEMEKNIIDFWQENRIFEKSMENRKDAKEYTFYDGPPFATGTPHYGHIVASILKDVVPRYWTMRGFYVERKWGWDCHGLPIENIVEKEMGSKKKKDIEEMGVEIFNEKCRSKVLTYVDIWEKVVSRMGRWADMKNAYRTMDKDYMESVWWVFKELWDKGLIYEDYRSMHICPRCETTLSQQEVSEGYKDVKDLSLIAKFELIDEPGTFVLAWTTTPWTLPGNVALAVGEDIDYIKLKIKNEELKTEENFILAKDRLGEVIKDREYKIIEELKGKDLVGKRYKPLFDFYAKDEKLVKRENGWKIYVGDFVTTDEGTGVVHIAPAFGEDDMKLGKENNLPFIQHVAMDGSFKEEMGELAGLNVKPIENPQATDVEIIKYLAKNRTLFHKEKFEHSYPHCWRCDTPLINYATSSWFVAVTKIKDKMLELAKNINWSPANMKEGRFGKWLEGARDWSISRQRFWASVMPIWVCQECGEKKVFGSAQEIDDKLGSFFVLRHGEAQNNLTSLMSCKLEDGFNLTEKGVADVKKSAQNLKDKKIDLIISSDIDRTKQTAEIVAREIGVEIIFDKRLRETNVGDYNGKTFGEIRNFIDKWNSAEEVQFPGGDSWQTIKERIENFYNDIFAKYRGKNILLISHGDIITSLEAAILGGDYLNNIREIHKNSYIKKAELKELNYKLIDLHKHIVDKITFKCEKCSGEMKRVSDVLDTWFDSGSMPYAQKHYPFENQKRFEENFPADFIAEGVDQTRAWFYYQHVIASGIKDSEAFKNVIVNGIVLAEDGKKMSKKLQNYPDPMEMFEKYGADSVRYYLMSSPVVAAQNMNFIENEVGEITRGMMRMLWNSYSFFVLYAEIDKFEADKNFNPQKLNGLLDKWIISELHMLIKEFNVHMENYELHKASRLLPKFVDNLSNWYIRRSRKRFWKSENDGDKNEAYQTLYYVLVELSKVMAPFTPFVAEEIYRNLTKEESVHLADFPVADESLIDEKVNGDMQAVREIVNIGLQLRAKSAIKVRQPLNELRIKNCELSEELLDIIKEEVNVKHIVCSIEYVVGEEGKVWDAEEKVGLNTEITPELKLEGQAREIIRYIQEMRKQAGYEVDNRITVSYSGMNEIFENEKLKDDIAKETLADEILSQENKSLEIDLEKEFLIDGENLKIAIKR